MARNKIQFQKGLSERQFRASYGTEEQCRAALAAWRWPQGFVCPRCAGRRCCEIKERKLYQCGSCRHQVSLTAGTIFHSTKLDLIVWFQAIYGGARGPRRVSLGLSISDLGLAVSP